MSFKEIVGCIVFSGLILLATTFPARVAPFSIEDDAVFLKITHPEMGFLKEYGQEDLYNSFSNFLLNSRSGASRFYPLAMCYTWVTAKITSGDPQGVQGILFCLSLLACLLFYVLLRALGISLLTAILFTGIFITGRYDHIWFHRSGELLSLLFLFPAFILIIAYFKSGNKIYLYSSLISVLFLTLNKESFPILIPCIGVCVALIYSSVNKTGILEAIKKTRFFQFIAVAIFCISGSIIVFVMMRGGNETYSIFSGNYLIHNFIFLSGYYYTWIPLIAVTICLLYTNKFTWVHGMLILTCLGWIFSQMLVYSGNEITPYSRYQVPSVILPLVLSVLSVDYFQKRNIRGIYLGFLIFLSGVLVINSKNNYSSASYYKARNTSYHHMLSVLTEKGNAEKDKILFVAGEGKADRFTELTAVYLSSAGLTMSPNQMIYAESQKQGRFFIHPNIELLNLPVAKKQDERIIKTFPEISADSSVKWVILCQPEENSSISTAEIEGSFKHAHRFPEPYFYASLQEIARHYISGNKMDNHFLTFVLYER